MSGKESNLKKLFDHNQSLAAKYQRKAVQANSEGLRATAAVKWQRYDRKMKSIEMQLKALTAKS